MKQINWCKKQDRGIKINEPSDNLSNEYYKSAEESYKVLRIIHKTQSKIWLATTKYYIQYFAVYSILMKLGIKCEIHDCTISLVKFLEKEEIIKEGTHKILEKSKQLRIDNQYYLKNKEVSINFDKLSEFLIDIRKNLDSLSEDRIKTIRDKLKEF